METRELPEGVTKLDYVPAGTYILHSYDYLNTLYPTNRKGLRELAYMGVSDGGFVKNIPIRFIDSLQGDERLCLRPAQKKYIWAFVEKVIECPEHAEFFSCEKVKLNTFGKQIYTTNIKGYNMSRENSSLEVGTKLHTAIEIAVNAATNAATTTKDTFIQTQKGMATLAALRSGLKTTPIPDKVKALLTDSKYGDLALGVLLHTAVPMLTLSKQGREAARCANIVATTQAASQITVLVDFIEKTIEGIAGKLTEGE